MEKEIFRVGDKVYHIEYEWGEVLYANNKEEIIDIKFKDRIIKFCDYRYISFAEYTLQGFSQKRPIELPEVGELCLVRDSDTEDWICGHFESYIKNENTFRVKGIKFIVHRSQIKRIKILD